MKTALFINFSNETFTGYWDGKGKTVKSGESVYMPDYLAAHFAKHLTNRELIRKGLEKNTSPKIKVDTNGKEYVDDIVFTEMFNKAYIPEPEEEGSMNDNNDDINVQIEVANKNKQKEKAKKEADPTQPQIVLPPDFDEEDEDEGKKEGFEDKPKK